jgi:hypothetical protein
MVEPTGARLRSVRTLPTKPEESMKFIGVQVDISGTIEAVYQSVRAVETAKPFLFIVGALLKPTQQAAIAPSGTSAAPTIDAQLDIIGAMQIEGGQVTRARTPPLVLLGLTLLAAANAWLLLMAAQQATSEDQVAAEEPGWTPRLPRLEDARTQATATVSYQGILARPIFSRSRAP